MITIVLDKAALAHLYPTYDGSITVPKYEDGKVWIEQIKDEEDATD